MSKYLVGAGVKDVQGDVGRAGAEGSVEPPFDSKVHFSRENLDKFGMPFLPLMY